MDRLRFLTMIPVAVTAVAVAPQLLIPKEGQSVWGPELEQKMRNQISTLRNNYIGICDPATGMDYSKIIILKKRRSGYSYLYQDIRTKEAHEEMLKYMSKYYEKG